MSRFSVCLVKQNVPGACCFVNLRTPSQHKTLDLDRQICSVETCKRNCSLQEGPLCNQRKCIISEHTKSEVLC